MRAFWKSTGSIRVSRLDQRFWNLVMNPWMSPMQQTVLGFLGTLFSILVGLPELLTVERKRSLVVYLGRWSSGIYVPGIRQSFPFYHLRKYTWGMVPTTYTTSSGKIGDNRTNIGDCFFFFF